VKRNPQMVNDLAQHVLAKHFDVIGRTVDLFDDDLDRFAFLITMMGSELASFVSTLAYTNPDFAKLPERMRFVAANFLLYKALGLKVDTAPTVQEMSDLIAAIHGYPEVSLS
jgi:hypothetical protein